MPNVMGREFPYTPEGMAAAEQYRRTFGMRDGGMLGFRPIGMQEGGVPLTKAQKIERLMALTGITDERLYMTMSEEQIDNALQQLEAEAAAKKQDLRRRGDPTPTPEESEHWKNRFPGFNPQGDYFPPERSEQPMQPLPPQGQPDVTAPFGITGDPDLDPILERIDRSLDRMGTLAEPQGSGPFGRQRGYQERMRKEELADPELPPFMRDPRFEGYYNPNQLNPYFNPNDIAVANGGYITRNRNRGGIMSLRRR